MPPPKKKFTPFEAIDEDLCYEIFQRLPIKTLCRFRCVCKRFNSLISSPHFIDLHHSLARSVTATPPHLKPYLHVKANRGDLIELWLPVPGLNDVVEHSRQPLYFPFRTDRDDINKRATFVGAIHGVVCFSYKSSSSSHSVIFWNPTIHKYVTLPLLRLSVNQCYALGFGYDTSRNDFKVVLIRIPQWTYKVYSTRQGYSWSRPRGFKLDSPRPIADHGTKVSWHFNGDVSPACFVNGTIHWGLSLCIRHNYSGFSKVQSSNSILMFDCESEEFRTMSLPAELFSEWSPVAVTLFEYAGMLAALVDKFIWVMEEHGVATSWKKLYSISYDDGILIYDPSFERLAPYGPSNTWNNMIKGRICHISRVVSCEHVYNETMLLMDHSEAQSYANEEIDIPLKLR